MPSTPEVVDVVPLHVFPSLNKNNTVSPGAPTLHCTYPFGAAGSASLLAHPRPSLWHVLLSCKHVWLQPSASLASLLHPGCVKSNVAHTTHSAPGVSHAVASHRSSYVHEMHGVCSGQLSAGPPGPPSVTVGDCVGLDVVGDCVGLDVVGDCVGVDVVGDTVGDSVGLDVVGD